MVDLNTEIENRRLILEASLSYSKRQQLALAVKDKEEEIQHLRGEIAHLKHMNASLDKRLKEVLKKANE